jgi:hypothetical protein
MTYDDEPLRSFPHYNLPSDLPLPNSLRNLLNQHFNEHLEATSRQSQNTLQYFTQRVIALTIQTQKQAVEIDSLQKKNVESTKQQEASR